MARIGLVAQGLTQFHIRNLEATNENMDTIIDFVLASEVERNWRLNSKQSYIYTLSTFSKFHNNKPFKEIVRQDVIAFLNSFRRSEPLDSLHRWIGTYNLYAIHLTMFFKWLYNPELEPKSRPKPPCVENIPQLKRKEKSVYKPTDMWTIEDDLLYLKYCPIIRDKCYHAISRDSSCRPHEILSLKIKDVVFKMVGNKQYVEILVNGKTGTRHVLLINSIPHLKNWMDVHPQKNNPNTALICSVGSGISHPITIGGLGKIYERSRKYFEQLLEKPDINPEDKLKIKEILKKPWNPYIRRHSALTEKSKFLKESVLRQHAGWSGNSEMHLKYVHFFGNESNEAILEAYGLKQSGSEIDKMQLVSCPNCSEPNEINAKFCRKCRMVLSYDAYNETVEEKEFEIKGLEDKYDRMESKFDQILSMIQQNPKLAKVKKEVISTI